MKTLSNFHTFQISFIRSSFIRGSYVRVYSNKFDQTKTIPSGYEFNSAYEVAQNYLESLGFNIIGISRCKNGYILISDTFKELL